MSGILNINKPVGPTSFDIVRTVRQGTGEKRVGHGGTLDPAASGVLVVLLGQAVRVSEYLMDLPKTYRAQIRLGVTTTTYDAEGEVTSSCDPGVSREEVEDAFRHFVGDISQVPPTHSAVKVGGKRAYALARKGEAPELKARTVSVYRIELLQFDSQELEIEVECGRGTYIRSLAHDLGQALGCGAHLSGLTRTRIGPFAIEDALTMDELEARIVDGTWADQLANPDAALLSLPSMTVSPEEEGRLRHGQAIAASLEPGTIGCEARAYSDSGSFVGIVVNDASDGTWRPRKIFQEVVGVAN